MAGFCPEPATSGLMVSNGGGVPDVASGVIQKWRGQKVENVCRRFKDEPIAKR